MPSSYTASLRLTLQATGENNNTWGTILNSGVFGLVDYAVAGRLGINLSGSMTLTTALGATDQARAAFLDVTAGSGGQIVIPAVSKGYFIRNAASGVVQVTAGGAFNASFNPGDTGPVFSDGANTFPILIGGVTVKSYVDTGVQSAIDYTNAAISAGNQLLPPASLANVSKALMIRNVGGTAVWTPSSVTPPDIPGFSAAITSVPNYWGALQSFGGSPSTLSARFSSVTEYTNVPSASPISGLFNFDITAAAIVYVFWGVSGNLTVNFRGSSSATFASLIGAGEIVTLELIINQGAATFAPTAFQVDGVAVTPQWAGGAQPAALAGTHSFYSFVIRNNGSGVFGIWASMTRFGP